MRDLWFGPLLAWVGVMVLFATNLASSYVPLGRANVVINLLIAAVMAAMLFIVLMDVRNAKALVRANIGLKDRWRFDKNGGAGDRGQEQWSILDHHRRVPRLWRRRW